MSCVPEFQSLLDATRARLREEGEEDWARNESACAGLSLCSALAKGLFPPPVDEALRPRSPSVGLGFQVIVNSLYFLGDSDSEVWKMLRPVWNTRVHSFDWTTSSALDHLGLRAPTS